MAQKISPHDLIAMDVAGKGQPLRIELAYARNDNLLFGEAIYRPEARLWLYRDLAEIVCLAARICHDQSTYHFVLYDGLRTIEAQEAMMKTRRVQDHPHWLEEPRMLSPPGAGAHPHGMAIDIALSDNTGRLIDMGTPFDQMSADPGPSGNPAHREYAGLRPGVKESRGLLDRSMQEAARRLGHEIYPLPEEWWDFRFAPAFTAKYAPISESDLPPEMRLMPI